jgi:hypothetical protein
MSDMPQRSGPQAWVYAVAFVGVALAAGLAGWAIGNSRPAPVVVIPPVTTTTTVEASTTPPPETTRTVPATVTVEATKTPTVTTVTNACLFTNVLWNPSGTHRVTVDYVQILTGKAAADAATAAGQESPPPNDYFIVNSSKKLRTFLLPKTADITILVGTGKHKVSAQYFTAIMPGAAKPQDEYAEGYYYVTVKAGTTVTKVEQIYLP